MGQGPCTFPAPGSRKELNKEDPALSLCQVLYMDSSQHPLGAVPFHGGGHEARRKWLAKATQLVSQAVEQVSSNCP